MEAANPHLARTGSGLAKQKRQSLAAGLHDAWGPPRDSAPQEGHTWRERHGLVQGCTSIKINQSKHSTTARRWSNQNIRVGPINQHQALIG